MAVATSLRGRVLGTFERLRMVYRTVEVTGTPVVAYLELLRVYQEDLNGNDILDGEAGTSGANFNFNTLSIVSASSVDMTALTASVSE